MWEDQKSFMRSGLLQASYAQDMFLSWLAEMLSQNSHSV